jgi:hypothetical protein
MKRAAYFALVLALGCDGPTEPGPENPAPPEVEPEPFLGLPDDQSRKVGDDNPRSPMAQVETMTAVQPASYGDYLEKKMAKAIHAEERRGRFVYFAVRHTRHVAFPSGPSASVEVIERFKAPVPAAE